MKLCKNTDLFEELFMGGRYSNAKLFCVDYLPVQNNSCISLFYAMPKDYYKVIERLVEYGKINETITKNESSNFYEIGFDCDPRKSFKDFEKLAIERTLFLAPAGLYLKCVNRQKAPKVHLITENGAGNIIMTVIKSSLENFQDRPFSPLGSELFETISSAYEANLLI